MNNKEQSGLRILFNFLILITFGFALILIKLLKRGEDDEVVVKSIEPKTPSKSVKKEAKEEPKNDPIPSGLNARQEIIVKELISKGEVAPKELQKLLPEVSTRTIRRDMDKLSEMKLVSQEGSTKSTYYKYIG